MRILLEEHQYPAAKVAGIIQGLTNLQDVSGMVSVSYVGYYYNPELHDMVFILPKVLMDADGLVFGHAQPEEIIDLKSQEVLSKEEREFIYSLSVWVYRAITVFRDAKPNSGVVWQEQSQQMSKGRLRRSNTYLDIMLALEQFHKEHQDFVFFVLKNQHKGYNKINWTKTISKNQAVIQDGTPIYLNPVNKRKEVNLDEELLVIFYSILNHLKETYGFPIRTELNLDIIKGKQFERYLNGFGRKRLREIKYKYFSDTALYLWDLCFAFFSKSDEVMVSTDQREYLLAKDFNVVFEAIIDELVGTDHGELPPGLADQEDGKRVDHLWLDEILLPTQEQKQVFYIGDSKYYKHSTPIGPESMYKQFTYAHNVIQWSFDNLYNEDVDKDYRIQLRDEETEGYNVIPNFFISADVNFETLDNKNDELTLHDERPYRQSQFSDRLFDRDTLLLSHYNVNFLYVLALYARNNRNEKQVWKTKVRKLFRKRVQDLLSKRYCFFAMQGYDTDDAKQYIQSHFKELLGKIYRTREQSNVYTLALEKHDEEISETASGLLDELRKHFYVTDCNIDENPETKMAQYIAGGAPRPAAMEDALVMVVDDNDCEETAEKIRNEKKYAIGLGPTSGALAIAEGFMGVKLMVLHKLTAPIVFKLKESPRLISSGQLNDIPHKLKDSDIYILFEVDSEQPELAHRITQYALNHPEGHTVRESYITIFSKLTREE